MTFRRCAAGSASPGHVDIIDWIDTRGAAEAARPHRALDAIEHEYASLARAAEGMPELLAALETAGCRLGLLTRNTRQVAGQVLRRLGGSAFCRRSIVRLARRRLPRPDGTPDCCAALAGRSRRDTVAVGDHLHDLLSGRAAGHRNRADQPPAIRHRTGASHRLSLGSPGQLLAGWLAARPPT